MSIPKAGLYKLILRQIFRTMAAIHPDESHTYLVKLQRAKHWTLFQAHPLLLLGLGMIGMLLLWVVLSSVWSWAGVTLDDLHYGRPRTYQTDTWVGHNEQTGHPSHFIALNLNGRVEIIEIAGGDPTHTRIYPGPQLYGTLGELTPVTIRFVTPSGKKYPNMIVLFGGSQLVYLNVGGTFILQDKEGSTSTLSVKTSL